MYGFFSKNFFSINVPFDVFVVDVITNLTLILHFAIYVPIYTKKMSTFAKIEFLIIDVKYSIIMALRDPGMREYLNLTKTDE